MRNKLCLDKLEDSWKSNTFKGTWWESVKKKLQKRRKNTKNKGETSIGRPRTRREKFGKEKDIFDISSIALRFIGLRKSPHHLGKGLIY